jgi:branched-chain amino acid transport system ATP-binding protein
MTKTQTLLLSAHKVTKRFGGLTAVNEVSVDLKLGQIHAVIGPNGAGKSTLANLLTGDLPASIGTCELEGPKHYGLDPRENFSKWSWVEATKKLIFFVALRFGTTSDSQHNLEVNHCPSTLSHGFKMPMRMQDVNQRAERAIELAGLKGQKACHCWCRQPR